MAALARCRNKLAAAYWPALSIAIASMAIAMVGCGGPTTPAKPTPPVAAKPKPTPNAVKSPTNPNGKPSLPPRPGPSGEPPRTSLAELMEAKESDDPVAAREALPFMRREIDENRAAAAGIRKIAGTHLTLYTDLPAAPEIDELPKVFDLAVPQWCEYFGIDPAKAAKWHMNGYLMAAKEKFLGSGLMPDDLPPFPFGFQRGSEFWLFEQPSGYFRRHLLLHEGTHGFMYRFLGGGGPAWYSEGVAELMGTHRWADGKLTLRHFPQSKEETPDWGRIKIVRDAYAAGSAMAAEQVLAYDDIAHRRLEPYAWCWALCAFLDGHPRFQAAFRAMRSQGTNRTQGFNDKFRQALAPGDWEVLSEQWQLFVVNLDYGYDVARAAFEPMAGKPLPLGGATIAVDATRGWQPSGVTLEAGRTYQITATGQFVVGKSTKSWPCEANGITLRYYQGKPLGILLAVIRNDDNPLGRDYFAAPIVVGPNSEVTAQWDGTLYFCVNEAPAGLADNSGELSVKVEVK